MAYKYVQGVMDALENPFSRRHIPHFTQSDTPILILKIEKIQLME